MSLKGEFEVLLKRESKERKCSRRPFCYPDRVGQKMKVVDLSIVVIEVFSDPPPGILISLKILFFVYFCHF